MLQFGSGDNFVSETQLVLTDVPQLTVAWWNYNSQINTDIVSCLGGSSGWRVWDDTGAADLRIGRSGSDLFASSNNSFSTNTLEHWCVTWNGQFNTADGDVIWYEDGVDTGLFGGVGSGNHVNSVPTALTVEVGGASNPELGHVAVWGRALSPSEVSLLALRRSPLDFPHYLLSYWVFDNETGIEHDVIGNLNLKVVGTPVHTFRGVDIVVPYPQYEFLPGTPAVAGDETIVADGGTYVLAGTDANLERHSAIDADGGTYALAGTDANLERHSAIDADAGAYALTGTDANLEHHSAIDADAGAYTLTGADAALDKLSVATDNNKYSLLHYGQVWQHQIPLPGGAAMSQGDKQQVLWGYPNILWETQAVSQPYVHHHRINQLIPI